jgi:hypothetical protein
VGMNGATHVPTLVTLPTLFFLHGFYPELLVRTIRLTPGTELRLLLRIAIK